MLEFEEQKTGKHMFKRGSDLRHGLIDVSGVLNTLNMSTDQGVNGVKRNRAKSEKGAWKKALKVM